LKESSNSSFSELYEKRKLCGKDLESTLNAKPGDIRNGGGLKAATRKK